MGGLIVGVLIFALGFLFIYLRKSEMEKVGLLASTETYTAQQLKELQKSIAGEIGAGSFRQLAEVKGKVECPSPLVSEMTQAKCVSCRSEVVREYEETYYEKDDKGNRHMRTRRGSDTMSDNTRTTPFYVVDATGKIRIEPDGAEFDMVQVKDSYEPANSVNMSGTNISWGGFNFSLNSSWSMGEGRKTLGYRFREYIFPLDRNVFILGEACDSGAELMIRKPLKEGRFLISTKTEEEIAQAAMSSANLYKYLTFACFGVGVLVAVLGLAGVF